MKTVKLLLIFTVLVQVYTSCESSIYVENEELPAAVSLDEVLNDYELKGYQRNTFNYDRLFYDNIHYFLQEYAAWEKVYTSVEGAVNEFDEENYLQFIPAGDRGNFKSSQDYNGTAIEHVYWDYNGIYEVENVTGNPDLKYLSLDYDYFSGEFFELRVLDDNTISLYQPTSGTEYRFRGRGYIAYKTAEAGKKREKQSVIDKQIKSIKL